MAQARRSRRLANPHRWQFRTVIDPSTSEPFTLDSSWDYVAHLLGEEATELEAIELTASGPDLGKTAYVMKEPLRGTILYVKVRPGSGVVIGYSFHYSNYPTTTNI